VARELIILPRFKRDYLLARKHPEFDKETLEHVLDLLVIGQPLPAAFNEHQLQKRISNWTGFTECHLGVDLLMIYRVSRRTVALHRIGTHSALFSSK
jgi:mRNA interferase YafQ